MSFLSTALVAKTLEMLHEAVPNVATIAAFVNPTNPNAEPEMREAQEALSGRRHGKRPRGKRHPEANDELGLDRHNEPPLRDYLRRETW